MPYWCRWWSMPWTVELFCGLFTAIRQSTQAHSCCRQQHPRNFIQTVKGTALGNVESRSSADDRLRCRVLRCRGSRVVKSMSCVCDFCASRKLWAICVSFIGRFHSRLVNENVWMLVINVISKLTFGRSFCLVSQIIVVVTSLWQSFNLVDAYFSGLFSVSCCLGTLHKYILQAVSTNWWCSLKPAFGEVM